MLIQKFEHFPDVKRIIEEAQIKLKETTGMNVCIRLICADDDLVDVIAKQCCETWNMDLEVLKQLSKKPELVAMRYIIGMLIYSNTALSQEQVAKYLGYKTHASICQMFTTAESLMYTKDELFNKYYQPVKHLFNDNRYK